MMRDERAFYKFRTSFDGQFLHFGTKHLSINVYIYNVKIRPLIKTAPITSSHPVDYKWVK